MPMLESNLDQSGFSARFSHVISSYFHSNCAAVGRGGYNRREDVICIQTALANAKISGHGSFWTGKIDGKMSPDMMGAITLFQRAVHACQRRSKISPPGRSKTSPLNVMRYAVLGGCPGSP